METDYISREAARPDAFCDGVSCQECPFLKNSVTGGCRVDDFIKTIPAADVRHVKEGYWTDGAGNHVAWDKMNPGCPNKSAYCSVCGEWLTASDEYPAIGKYCPNCGAKMGGTDGRQE